MFRCLKPGCPVRCGSFRTPSCVERLLFWTLLLVLSAGLVVSLGMGVRWLRNVETSGGGIGSGQVAGPPSGASKGSVLPANLQFVGSLARPPEATAVKNEPVV